MSFKTHKPNIIFSAFLFKVRQNYIRRRLLNTYKAVERLSKSEFNLDKIEITPSTATASVSTAYPIPDNSGQSRLAVPGANALQKQISLNSAHAAALRVAKQRAMKNLPLTLKDVERERGKPLSKYERNMMIFNWLHTLDDTATIETSQ